MIKPNTSTGAPTTKNDGQQAFNEVHHLTFAVAAKLKVSDGGGQSSGQTAIYQGLRRVRRSEPTAWLEHVAHGATCASHPPGDPTMTARQHARRALGVQRLIAYCLNPSCRHDGLIEVSKYPDDTAVPVRQRFV